MLKINRLDAQLRLGIIPMYRKHRNYKKEIGL